MHDADVVVAGAGVIGMALALELQSRGRRVVLLDRGSAGSGASSAAAGMLAAHDTAHPAPLRPLALLSERLYPAFLERLAQLAPATPVALQTAWTLEAAAEDEGAPLPDGVAAGSGPFRLLQEYSLDPRQLAAALRAACEASGVRLLENTSFRNVEANAKGRVHVSTAAGTLRCEQFVDCTGAWGARHMRPVKGQMLRVALGQDTPKLPGKGSVVLRTPLVYVVPRLDGSALIGATVEEKGFCVKTKNDAIDDLRTRAAALLPSVAGAPELERWAGLRPASTDGLPLLGVAPDAASAACFVATGHFRNGILLAPATAQVMAQLLCGESTSIPLTPFRPDRFAPS